MNLAPEARVKVRGKEEKVLRVYGVSPASSSSFELLVLGLYFAAQEV